ncbi:hypothetical protein PT974_11071 [Cladobotryum mycophilum]|uniref:Uncharacterized protein n=1 Tax=Cladobotryum mycophilum TaxID=491253 RepID=A0ABR0SBJ8_9HYPO
MSIISFSEGAQGHTKANQAPDWYIPVLVVIPPEALIMKTAIIALLFIALGQADQVYPRQGRPVPESVKQLGPNTRLGSCIRNNQEKLSHMMNENFELCLGPNNQYSAVIRESVAEIRKMGLGPLCKQYTNPQNSLPQPGPKPEPKPYRRHLAGINDLI